MINSSFIPFSELPQAVQDRAMALFVSTYGMTLDAAVAQAEAEQQGQEQPEPPSNPRIQRAQRYLARFGASFRLAKNGVLVPSESHQGEWYLVQGERCSCRDRGLRCKHVPAVSMWSAK